jgi:hypothetical protein
MIISFGRHKGISGEMLILRDPSYVKWILIEEGDSEQFIKVQNEMYRLISKFDAKPFIKNCLACNERVATRVSIYKGDFDHLEFCNICDPYDWGATPGKLVICKKYMDILWYIDYGRRSGLRRLLRSVAQSKGLPHRITEKRAKIFFDEPFEHIPPKSEYQRNNKWNIIKSR